MTSTVFKKRSILSLFLRTIIYVVVFFIILFSLVFLFTSPSNERDWTLDQVVLPYAIFEGDQVTIKNIRNFSYTSRNEYTPSYYDKTFDLKTIKSVDYIVEPLASVAVAHTFLSFGFENGEYVTVSIEIRKEKGEEFSPFKALFNKYEIMYVIVDEKDTIKLRAIYRDNPVYLYPVNVSSEKIRPLFIDVLNRANKLNEKPEFYNTLTNTCMTNIVDHINNVSPERISFDWRILFPLDSDEFAYELGLIGDSSPFEQLRSRYLINDFVEEYANDPNFSVKIREAQQHSFLNE